MSVMRWTPVSGRHRGRCWLLDDVSMDLGRQRVDRPGQLGVRPQLPCLAREVVVGLGSLELGLAVLADHDEGREEDRLERDDQGQPRPGIGLDEQHPARERGGMEVDEGHGAGEAGDRVRRSELGVGGPPSGVLDHDGMVGVWGWGHGGPRRAATGVGVGPTAEPHAVGRSRRRGGRHVGSGQGRGHVSRPTCRAAGRGCRGPRLLVGLVADDAREPQLEAAGQHGEPPDRPGDAERSVARTDDEEHTEQHPESTAKPDGPCPGTCLRALMA